MPGELPRRIFHFCGSLTLAVSGLVLPDWLFLPAAVVVAAGFLGLDAVRFFHGRVNRWFIRTFRVLMRQREMVRITGASYVILGSVLAFLLFDRVIASLAVCFLAVGDPVSGMIGGKWGRRLPKNKSLASSLGCFVACLTAGTFYHWWFGLSLSSVGVGALLATVIESVPLPVDDNLTMPLVSGGAITLVQLMGVS